MNKNFKALIYLAGYKSLTEFAEDIGVSLNAISMEIYKDEKKYNPELSLKTKIRIVEKLNERLKYSTSRRLLGKYPLTLYDVFPDTMKISPEVVVGSKSE
jgi:predicted DNA-binding protein YlxM (UPF0122 family)